MLLRELDDAITDMYGRVQYPKKANVVVIIDGREYRITNAVPITSKGDYGTLKLIAEAIEVQKETIVHKDEAGNVWHEKKPHIPDELANKITPEILAETAKEILSLLDVHSNTYNHSANYLKRLSSPDDLKAECRARYGMDFMTEYQAKVMMHDQALYAVDNLKYWRHPKAKELKAILRKYVAQKDYLEK